MVKHKSVLWLLIVALLIIVPLLAACGGAATAPTKEQPAPPPVEKEAPKAEEPSTTTGPPAIPHPLEGRDDCVMCHGEGGLKPFPADHAGRTSDICTTCHQPAG